MSECKKDKKYELLVRNGVVKKARTNIRKTDGYILIESAGNNLNLDLIIGYSEDGEKLYHDYDHYFFISTESIPALIEMLKDVHKNMDKAVQCTNFWTEREGSE